MIIPSAFAEHRSRRGYTLIEVLVAVGIIGILFALLLPAIQMARESARRLQCHANLHQIGVAMHAYNAIHNMFPPSVLEQCPGCGGRDRISAWAFLLPQLEQHPLFTAINFDFYNYDGYDTPVVENHTARNAQLAIFLCPSDGQPLRGNNYRLNRGTYYPERYGPGWSGPFRPIRQPNQSMITDGLSRTAFVSERIAGTFNPGAADRRRDIRVLANPLPEVLKSDDIYIRECLNKNQVWWEYTVGRYWYYAGSFHDAYNHNGRPNDPRSSCGNFYGLHPPRSFHPGIVNTLYGDGHVEPVANTIDTETWASLGTFNAGD